MFHSRRSQNSCGTTRHFNYSSFIIHYSLFIIHYSSPAYSGTFVWVRFSYGYSTVLKYKVKRGNRSFIDVRTGSRIPKPDVIHGFYAKTSHLLRRGDSRIDRHGNPCRFIAYTSDLTYTSCRSGSELLKTGGASPSPTQAPTFFCVHSGMFVGVDASETRIPYATRLS